MELALALAAGVAFASGVYLVQRRDLVSVALGLMIASHGINLALLAAGYHGVVTPPIAERPDDVIAEPLPQAFTLTAIVIGMGFAIVLLSLAARGRVTSTADTSDASGVLRSERDAQLAG